jgi:hypothetical protein
MTITRRGVLTLSGVSLSAAVLRQDRAAVALPPPSIAIGITDGQFPAFATAVRGGCGIRLFIGEYGLVPSVWPTTLPSPTSLLGGPVIPPGAQTVMSIRPMPYALLSGLLDDQIRSLCHSAPPGSSLSAWHENGPANPMDYPREVNQASVSRAMHERMQRLCTGTGVKYGSIICGPAQDLALWNGRNLDWYGIDTYLFPKYRLPYNRINWKAWRARQAMNMIAWRALNGGKHPVVKVCETNAVHDAERSEWFAGVAAWLNSIGGNAMLTFWSNGSQGHGGGDSEPDGDSDDNGGQKGSGGLSGLWPPSDGVKRTLSALAQKYYLDRVAPWPHTAART